MIIYPLTLLAFHLPFMDQSLVLLLFGLLIFGKRLPEVGKSLGQGIVQFKKGLKGIEDEVEQAVNMPATQPTMRVTTPALTQSPTMPPSEHKFDPMTGKPLKDVPVIPAGAKFDPYTGQPLTADAVPAGDSVK
jgi:sec-independent protein translocase protein TatA